MKIDLCQTKIKLINGPFYTYHQIRFTTRNASFCDIFLSICHITYFSFCHYWKVYFLGSTCCHL